MKKLVIVIVAIIALAASVTGVAALRKRNLHRAEEQQNAASVTATEQAKYETLSTDSQEGNSVPATAATAAPAGFITADEALNKALAHAGLDKGKINIIKNVLDDDGEYEIEFHSGGKEYDYEINGRTGAVVSCDIEIIRTTAPATTGGNGNAGSSSSGRIGTDAALAAALKHAGLEKSSVTVIKNELDGYEYDVEFISGGKEYEYEINAATGKVISCDIEFAKTTTTAAGSFISKDAALKNALSHAGVAADKATVTKNELDTDDGTAKYEIEFRCDGYEFDYEINAATGAVISSEKERD